MLSEDFPSHIDFINDPECIVQGIPRDVIINSTADCAVGFQRGVSKGSNSENAELRKINF